MGADLAGVAGQVREQVELLGGELDLLTPTLGLVVDQVERERSRHRQRRASRSSRPRPGDGWRTRIRASSSAMPKGLVT